MTKYDEAIALLEKAAKQFRFYQEQHSAKLDYLPEDGPERSATRSKALINDQFATEIECFLIKNIAGLAQ